MNCLVLKVSPVKGTTLFYIKNDKEEFTKELAHGSNMVECLNTLFENKQVEKIDKIIFYGHSVWIQHQLDKYNFSQYTKLKNIPIEIQPIN